MNRSDLHLLADLRLQEAEALLQKGLFDGAYYLAGYSVECALKACIARQTNQYDFPPEWQYVRQIYTHNLDELRSKTGVQLAGEFTKELMANPEFKDNWAVVKDWNEHSRYKIGTPEAAARDLLSAVAEPKNGILQWLKKWW